MTATLDTTGAVEVVALALALSTVATGWAAEPTWTKRESTNAIAAVGATSASHRSRDRPGVFFPLFRKRRTLDLAKLLFTLGERDGRELANPCADAIVRRWSFRGRERGRHLRRVCKSLVRIER